MNQFYDEPAIRIRTLRENRRFTREELAEKADISPKFLYEIESRKKGFTADTLFRIAQALSVSCEYILTGEDSVYCGELYATLSLFNNEQSAELIILLKAIHNLMSK